MKVLILGSKEYPMGSNKGDDSIPSGGMEFYVENLIGELKKYSDMETIVVTRKFRDTESYEENDNLKVLRVPFMKGVYFRNPTFNLRSALKALTLNFDIMITNGDIANILGLFISKIKRKPIVMVCHGIASEQPQYNFLLKFLFRIIEKSTYSHADAVITHSPHQVKGFTRKYDVIFPGLDRERLENLDSDKIKSIKSKYMTQDKKVILFTGRLVKVKGLEYLIKAFPMVKSDYVCFIVGDGPSRKEYENLAKELGTNVVFTGFRNDVQNFLSFSDVFVLPSTGGESLNYSMIEAAYMKVSIIVTDLKILPNSCGIIVPKKDEKSIANAINEIFQNENLRKKLIENAFKYTTKFDWKKAGSEYYKILKRFER
jgi:glycosyltransferase involved in cell wall biosynthesis